MNNLKAAAGILRENRGILFRLQLLHFLIHSPFYIWFFLVHSGSGISILPGLSSRYFTIAASENIYFLTVSESVLMLNLVILLSPLTLIFLRLVSELTHKRKLKFQSQMPFVRRQLPFFSIVFLSALIVYYFSVLVFYFYLGMLPMTAIGFAVAAGVLSGLGWFVLSWLICLLVPVSEGISVKSALLEAVETLRKEPVQYLAISILMMLMTVLLIVYSNAAVLMLLLGLCCPLPLLLVLAQKRMNSLEIFGEK